MKNKFDKILLTFLWLIIALLGTCFWFNTRFGFNIFSKANWDYLAYMQASQQPISPIFYTSLIASVFVLILGLYILHRPRYRKIKLHTSAPTITRTTTESPTKNHPAPIPAKQEQPTTQHPSPMTGFSTLERPKRLNTGLTLPVPTEQSVAPITAPVITTGSAMISAPTETSKWDKTEITNIFKDAGYEPKETPKIKGLQTILFAIGSNETIWIGATDCQPNELSKRIETIQQVFSDTLEDIEITINGFILNSTPPQPTSDILVFDNTETLRDYINAHRNTPLPPDEMENFEAFSSYISTVIEYLGRL